MNQWVTVLFTNVLIPELSRWLASREPGAPFPSEAEITAKLKADGAALLNAGEAFLQENGAA